MTELTPQDKESYKKLYDAADNLVKKIPPNNGPKIGESFTLKELTSAFFCKLQLIKADSLSSFNELQSQVELTGGYLTMYQLFVDAIEAIPEVKTKTAINEASQKLLGQYNQLKAPLEAVDNDFLDDVTIPRSDPLFLGFLQDSKDYQVKTWTNQILSDQAPALMDGQVKELINAWGTAVKAFVEDASNPSGKVKPLEIETIAHFFCIHDQLEGLYSELSTAVALNS